MFQPRSYPWDKNGKSNHLGFAHLFFWWYYPVLRANCWLWLVCFNFILPFGILKHLWHVTIRTSLLFDKFLSYEWFGIGIKYTWIHTLSLPQKIMGRWRSSFTSQNFNYFCKINKEMSFKIVWFSVLCLL